MKELFLGWENLVRFSYNFREIFDVREQSLYFLKLTRQEITHLERAQFLLDFSWRIDTYIKCLFFVCFCLCLWFYLRCILFGERSDNITHVDKDLESALVEGWSIDRTVTLIAIYGLYIFILRYRFRRNTCHIFRLTFSCKSNPLIEADYTRKHSKWFQLQDFIRLNNLPNLSKNLNLYHLRNYQYYHLQWKIAEFERSIGPFWLILPKRRCPELPAPN